MLFSHPIKKRPGEYFVIEPKYIVFLPMTTKSFNEINFKLVDLEGNIVSFNGETIKFLIVITQV